MATPQVMIQFSDDGGHTWSHEIWRDLVGDDKKYLNRVRIQQGGTTYNRIFRLRFSGDTSFTLVSAHADVAVGI